MRSIGALLLTAVCLTLWQTSASGLELRVLTYNIHHGEGTDGKLDLERIAEVIRGFRPDLVALQEVDKGTERTRKVDQAAELGRLTGMHAVFGKALDYDGGEYGAAILSRWPFERTDAHVLPGSLGHETRPALTARLKPGEDQPAITLVSIHLDHQEEKERLTQAQRLLELIAAERDRPVILAGDFNALQASPVLRLFETDWMNPTASKPLFTIPSEKPTRQIDYVLFHPADRWRVVKSEVVESDASDHCPLLVVVELTSE